MRVGWIEISTRVQNFIAEEFVDVAVQFIRARLGDYVHHGPGVATVLGVESIGDHTEFLDAVGRGLDGGQVHKKIVGITAVDAEVVGASTSTIDGNGARAVAAVNDRVAGTDGGHDARLQLQKLVGIARVERKLD